jgi:hypothetical protein
MGIDPNKFYTPAIRGDVSGAVISISIALGAVADALDALKAGRDPTESVTAIRMQVEKLDKMFDELTGYTGDGTR